MGRTVVAAPSLGSLDDPRPVESTQAGRCHRHNTRQAPAGRRSDGASSSSSQTSTKNKPRMASMHLVPKPDETVHPHRLPAHHPPTISSNLPRYRTLSAEKRLLRLDRLCCSWPATAATAHGSVALLVALHCREEGATDANGRRHDEGWQVGWCPISASCPPFFSLMLGGPFWSLGDISQTREIFPSPHTRKRGQFTTARRFDRQRRQCARDGKDREKGTGGHMWDQI